MYLGIYDLSKELHTFLIRELPKEVQLRMKYAFNRMVGTCTMLHDVLFIKDAYMILKWYLARRRYTKSLRVVTMKPLEAILC